MKESKFQKEVKDELKKRFPGCIVLKHDPGSIQGIPDLSVFWQNHWGMLEVKNDPEAEHQPNQDYWVDYCNNMSYAAFINPQNKEEVLNGMERSFKV